MRFFAATSVLFALIATVCAYDLIPQGGHCTDTPNKCKPGLACVGPEYKKKCKVLKKVNERCGQDPYWVCEKGLACEYNKCRIVEGGDCTKDPNWCAKGLSCVGPAYKKKCKTLKQVNERCGQDPYWVCDAGLKCQHNRCRIARGFECTDDPKWCAKGLQCVGTKYYKQCEKPIKLGGECLIEPWWVCAEGLECDHNICRISQGGECTKTPYLCAKGLECVGTQYYKQCEKPIPAGGACLIEPWWVCKKGLVCEHNICRIPKDGDCTYKEDYCVKGLSCVGPKHNKLCKYPLKKGEPCTSEYDVCGKGLVCGGLGKARRCIDGEGEGYACRIGNPKMQCKDGLKCIDGFCRYY